MSNATHQHPVEVLNAQCMAAAALFEAASLRAERKARELPAGSPEAAVKLCLAAIYSDCMRDMTRLAREFVSPAREHQPQPAIKPC
ncbi:MAG: hypothetical protein IOC58_04385 [Methylobacterium sp.]|nr:hypothetical protein [Methylobacterium sp.]MCA4923941.1 hypothetical protein [Methylobacterium sp.]